MTSTVAPRQRTPRPFTYEGQVITCPSGAVVIAIQWTQVAGRDVYRATVNHGGPGGLLGAEVDGASYGDEQTARDEAYRMVQAYADGATPVQLAERREDLAVLIEADERRYGPEAKARAYRRRIELDSIAPLAGRAVQMALVTDLRHFLTATRAA